MDDRGRAAWVERPGQRRTRRSLRGWLMAGGLALAFVLAMGVGAILGTGVLQNAQAATLANNGAQAPLSARFPFASTPGVGGPGQGPGQGHGACQLYTVTSVSGQTIVAKASNGSSVTIHETSSTQYTKSGQAASASAVTNGSQISVMGTTNADGSITATSIDVR